MASLPKGSVSTAARHNELRTKMATARERAAALQVLVQLRFPLQHRRGHADPRSSQHSSALWGQEEALSWTAQQASEEVTHSVISCIL